MVGVSEAQAQDLLSILRGSDTDKKIADFVSIKAHVKHQSVQVEAIPLLFEACKIGIQSPNNSLYSQALSCLGHLIKRVTIQEPSKIRPQANHLLPLLVEKLGDSKERNRTVALNGILDVYKNCPQEVEIKIKEFGLGNKAPRIRQEAVKWLVHVHSTTPGFPFRGYVPSLMVMLEDASEPVRETAKEAVVELFRNAPDHAKSDLKREMAKRQVRKGIATYVLQQLGLTSSSAPELATGSARSQDGRDDDTASSRQGGKSVAGSMASSTYVGSMPGSDMEELEPLFVNTNRELEDMMDAMLPSFEGRESEHNWMARDTNIAKIRQLLRGNAHRDYQVTFLAKIKALLDGIIKALNSLRTQLSTSGGQCIKDLAIVAGPGIDPFVEILLVSLIKMCAATKKLASQLAQVVVAVIFANVSYHPKVLQHVWYACQDKNVQPRLYAAGWIAIFLETHADHKAHIEHTGGVDTFSKCIKKGLADANPGVRENMRNTYWKFGSIWPEPAQAILEGLDNTSKKLLEKTNPNVPIQPKGAASLRTPAPGRGGPARPSIRDAILASKRSKGNLKAQSSDGLEKQRVSPPPSGPSGLASAPVRRPQLKVRPATLPDPATVLERGIRTGSPSVGAPSSKTSPHNASRGNSSHTPPLSPPHRSQRGITPGRLQSPLVGGPRKLTVLEQLNHSDWKIRVEGVVVVACILAKRTPPNYDGQKMPTLPPSDVFAPTLAKLLNDPQPEVVEHVVAPEVLAELAKVVPMEQVVPKVLLLSEGDDEQHAQPINTSSMPALKQLMTQDEAANLLFQLFQSMNSPGVVPRKYSVGTITTIQKRKIIRGCLIWMNELVENYASGMANEFFSELNNYKLVVNRLIGMLNTTKAQNLTMLAALLKGLQKLDVETFDKILLTFESSIIKDLRRAWGVNVEDDVESVVVEEKVADVQQVLGSVPQVGGTMLPPSQARRVNPEPASPDDSIGGLEDFALINIPPAPRPVTPPAHSTFDREALKNLPPLPSTPERSARKIARTEEKPAIKVYQDPVVDSNGAVATGDRTTMSGGNEWHRSKLRKQISSSNLPKTPGDSSRLLRTLIQRLRARDLDTQAFRKLIGIARENPVREPLQEANGEDLHDIWQGGPVFEELLTALLDYLGSEDIELSRMSDLRVQGLLVLKQLLAKAAPYFARHEAEVLSTLIGIRGKHPAQSQVTTGVEEISEEYMQVADPKAGIDAILDVSLPTGNPSFRPPTQSWCMSLFCLAALVRASAPSFLETQLDRLGQLAVKSLHDDDSEVRRACVAMCIELHSKLNDDERLFDDILKGMRSGHQNLLAYYFAKREGELKQ